MEANALCLALADTTPRIGDVYSPNALLWTPKHGRMPLWG